MADPRQRVQELTEQYQKLQQDLQAAISSRQKLESQQQENKGVQKEFAGLPDDAKIYKLVGPVLLAQDKTEAVLAVDGRLDFIVGEIKRVEKQIAEIEGKVDKVRMEIMQFQAQMEEQPVQGQAQAVA